MGRENRQDLRDVIEDWYRAHDSIKLVEALKTFDQMAEDQDMLRALEQMGVDNWDGHSQHQ